VDKADKDSIRCDGLTLPPSNPEKDSKGKSIKCGCCEGKNSCSDPDSLSLEDKKKCAWKGVYKNNFYTTPAELFTGEYDRAEDSADTSGGFQWVLDGDGIPRKVGAGGVAIFTNPVGGQSVRQRYPVMPRHEEGSSTWKELQYVKALLRRKDAIKEVDNRGRATGTFAATANEVFGASPSFVQTSKRVRTLWGDDHEHTVVLTDSQRRSLAHGHRVMLNTSAAADGHSHEVLVGPDETDVAEEHTLGTAEFPPLGDPHVQRVDGLRGDAGHVLGEEEVAVEAEAAPSLAALAARLDAQDQQAQQLLAENAKLKQQLQELR